MRRAPALALCLIVSVALEACVDESAELLEGASPSSLDGEPEAFADAERDEGDGHGHGDDDGWQSSAAEDDEARTALAIDVAAAGADTSAPSPDAGTGAGSAATQNRLVAPWSAGTKISIMQGPRGTFSHQQMLGSFDVGMPAGTTYRSVGLGIVTQVKTGCPSGTINVNPDRRCGQGYGNHVIIRHLEVDAAGVEKPRLSKSGKTVHSVYGHMHRVLVTVGQRVRPGTALGSCGLTGYTTGYHLHFQFQSGPTPLLVDPYQIGYRDATRDEGLEGAPSSMLTKSPY